jgi:creatinine amidohydrolase/Fe(II)-dependent formamide hydrolase-like protein
MSGYNPRRGDVKLQLTGCEVVLRPSFGAIAALEEHFGKSIFDLARDFCEGKCARAMDMRVIIEAGVRGSGAEPPADLPERMVDTGLATLIAPLGTFLAHACGLEA